MPLALALALVFLRPVGFGGAASGSPADGYLDDVPDTTPASLGDIDLTSLQYADPTEGVDVMQPPVAAPDGGASAALPLSLPAGRAGVQPDLALSYDSSGGNGWVGVGWDLSVGAITLDTEFGAPRYLSNKESETYQLDGDRLSPNAIRTDLAPRVGAVKADFVRAVDNEREQIARYGTGPGDYCWVVRDKDGNTRYYGGEPNDEGTCSRVSEAIVGAIGTSGVKDGVRGDFFWGLTYVVDISGNTVHYGYDKDPVSFGKSAPGGDPTGVSIYLSSIEYTGLISDDPTIPAEPAYRVTFVHADGAAAPRKDVGVDASGGRPLVVKDLLRRIKVEYLGPGDAADSPVLVKGWKLTYDDEGPYDKSLLTKVTEFGSDGVDGPEHVFQWYDDVHGDGGKYQGFDPTRQWGRSDTAAVLPNDHVNIAAESALGSSHRIGGDGGSYIGFNPAIPSKIGSFGGSFNVAGGETTTDSVLVDLNGDGLPDRVYAVGTAIKYRENLHRPGGSPNPLDGSWFGPERSVGGIDALGRSTDLRIDLHYEVYPVVAIQVGGGFGFSFGKEYFTDVNGDGRVDFVKSDRSVWYNVLVPANEADADAPPDADWTPKFVNSETIAPIANRLEVPLDEFVSSLADEMPADVTKLLEDSSPRIDTVRRWVAPFTGTVKVTGAVGLVDPANYTGDGAQVSVEHHESTQWSHVLTKASPSAEPDGTPFQVTAGDQVWFRVHVIRTAAGDHVSWDPQVTYTDPGADTWSTDAQGRSQSAYQASSDFTTFGRTGARTTLTEPGQTKVTVALTPGRALSDDVTVELVDGRGRGDGAESTLTTLVAGTATAVTGTKTLTVTAPSTNPGPKPNDTSDDYQESDWIEVHVTSDSPVDPTALGVKVTLTDLAPTPPELKLGVEDAGTVKDLDVPLDVPVVPNVRVFGRTTLTSPYVPWTAPETGRATLRVRLDGAGLTPSFSTKKGEEARSSDIAITVKRPTAGRIAKTTFVATEKDATILAKRRFDEDQSLSFEVTKGTTYWLDVSAGDPSVGARLATQGALSSTIHVTYRTTDNDGNAVDADTADVASGAPLSWPDVDGVFPSANRGWGLAGYNADGKGAKGGDPLVEAQFDLKDDFSSFDKDTSIPDSGTPGSARGAALEAKDFDEVFPFLPWVSAGGDVADQWRAGPKDTVFGKAGEMQADRLGEDLTVPRAATDAQGRHAPLVTSVNGDFNIMVGLIANFTAAAGGGREISEFEDYNGDGLPDVRSGSKIDVTGPRGDNAASIDVGQNPFDTSLAVGGGLSGSAIAISPRSKTSASKGGGKAAATTKKTSRGMNVGLGFDVGAEWTNPVADGEAKDKTSGGSDKNTITADLADSRGTLTPAAGAKGTIIERTLEDMNGDGLPDRVDSYTSDEIWVSLNLGYRFADQAVQWSTGRLSYEKSVTGNLSAGFQFDAYEFAGGIAYSEAVGYGLLGWEDLDGDGVPDRTNKVRPPDPNDPAGAEEPRTVFGSADGMGRTEEAFGNYFHGDVRVDVNKKDTTLADDNGNMKGVSLPGGQTSVSRSTSLTGGVDFSIYIGPICAVACYVVINPGVHAGYNRSTDQVQLTDVNGDGYPDSVRSTSDNDLQVRLNRHGRTNLLESVTNPLGGQFRLDYERTGNTTTNPESIWVMKSVEMDDGRSGDGVNVQKSTFDYSGAVFDPALREQLGFDTVVETQLGENGATLRSFERSYRNANPFDEGLLVRETTKDGGGHTVQDRSYTYDLLDADPRSNQFGSKVAASTLPAVGDSRRFDLLDRAMDPVLTQDDLRGYDTADNEQQQLTDYTYDNVGNVTGVHDGNESETTGDDTYTKVTYPQCAPRRGDRVLSGDESWVSVPQTVTVFGSDHAGGDVMQRRDGGPDLCANAAPIRLAELVSPASQNDCHEDLYAITEMTFDDHGSVNSVAYPDSERPACVDYPEPTIDSAAVSFDGCASLSAEDDARRYCVDYVFDDHRFTDIAEVTDNHGVGSSATYDGKTGRLETRTDENGKVTAFTYDTLGRTKSVAAPRENTDGIKTITFDHGPFDASLKPDGAHVWAAAHQYDVVHPANTIDTATFVDGMGRVVQHKRDANVDGVAGEVRIVEGAVEYDALGHAAKEWYPTVEKIGDRPLSTYNTNSSESEPPADTFVPKTAPFVRTFDALDRLTKQVLPDGSQETTSYDYAQLPDPTHVYSTVTEGLITMLHRTSTDALGKKMEEWADVGDAIYLRRETPAPANNPDGSAGPLGSLPSASPVIVPRRIKTSAGTPGPISTNYEYDRLGRLTAVVDAAGARTTHVYDPTDNDIATDTPDGGLVARTFAPAGNALTESRARGTTATYLWDRDRMIGMRYSDTTPAVDYEYGVKKADPADNTDNVVGRVAQVTDGAMTRTYAYDVDGNVARETAEQAPDPFGKGSNEGAPTWTTRWSYDSLARLRTLTYPGGEVLEHGYDLGGRPTTLVSHTPQTDLFDQYGNVVHRPDLTLHYVDGVTYDQFGTAVSLEHGNGVRTRYTYEPTRRFLAGVKTDSTVKQQVDGTTSVARPLQRLQYTYDVAGNVRDAVNRLYDNGTATKVTGLGPVPENNVPGPSQQSYTYDGFYRLTGGQGTYVDRQQRRDFSLAVDYAPNGNLLGKAQATTTTGTTGGGKKGTAAAALAGAGLALAAHTTAAKPAAPTTTTTCDSDSSSGGGTANQDLHNTFTQTAADVEYVKNAAGKTIHQLKRRGARTYTYDATGNLTEWREPCAGGKSEVRRTLDFDAENRVTRIHDGNNDTEYRYDAEGERTLEWGAGGHLWFVNDHWNTANDGHRYANVYLGDEMVAIHRTSSPTAQSQPATCTDTVDTPCVCPKDGACVVASAALCPSTQLYDPGTSTCQPRPDVNIHYLHKDLQGSLRVATDEVGKVFQYLDYLPTGKPWVLGQSTIKDTPYLFAGGWTDATYDLVNFGQRWYAPREQQFHSPEPLLAEDPMAAVDDPSLLSAYTYAAANPLRYVDPTGRAPYETGTDYNKHQRGTFTISEESRAKRVAPAITFGGRNDGESQKRIEAWDDANETADDISTALKIEQSEDGSWKVKFFGQGKEEAAGPGPAPKAGSSGDDDATTAPPNAPTTAAAKAPDAAPATAAQPTGTAAPSSDAAASGPAAAPAPAKGGAGDGSPAPPPPPPPPPAAAAPSAPGSGKK